MSEQRMPHGGQIEEIAVARMHRDLTRPKWWQTIWGRLSIAGGFLVLASSGVSALVLLSPQEITEQSYVHCMEGPHRNSDGTLSGTGMMVANQEGIVPIEDAVEICSRVWESGAMSGNDPLDPSPAPGDVPDSFTVCVAAEGYAVVVPGSSECSALRLHPHHP